MTKMKLLSLLLILPLTAARCSGMDTYNTMIIGNMPIVKGGVTVTWLGTAGVHITDGRTGILIDPYVSRFGMARVFFGRPLEPKKELIRQWTEKLGKAEIQAIIVSHSHFDHSVDAPFFAREAGAPLVGTESTLNIGRGAGLREDELNLVSPGQAITIGHFTIRFIESAHGPVFGKVPYPGAIGRPLAQPARAKDYRLGGVFGVLISHPAGTILHHGSAGFIPGMYQGVRADIVLLGIAGRGDMEKYLEEVPLRVKAKTVIPVHIDNFFKPIGEGMSFLPASINFNEFCEAAGRYRSDFTVRTLPLARSVRILPVNGR